MHTGGEPVRIITGGLPEIPGITVLERRRYFREHLDHIRTGLMWEPRGHSDMYGVVPGPPDTPDGDLSAFFLHNEGYSTMCGHATLALARYAVERGTLSHYDGKRDILIDVPAGRIRAKVIYQDGKYIGSSFFNVPSFVFLRDGVLGMESLGQVHFDIAYGGAFYAFVKAADFELEMVPSNSNKFIELGRMIKRGVAEKYPVQHPFEPDLSFLYGTIFTGPAADPRHHSRNVCIFANGELDRSATGSGVSARAALHFDKGELKAGERIIIESILGTTMEVEVAETTTFGPYKAVVPRVSGKAYFTGEHVFVFEDEDPLIRGFILR
jgi:proline racemase